MKIKLLSATAILCLNFSVFADINTVNKTCEILAREHQGRSHLALKETIVNTAITAEGMRQERNSTTMILPFWPSMHSSGIRELRRALEQKECEIDPMLLECLVVANGRNQESVIIRKTSSQDIIFSIESKNDSMTYEQIAFDFKNIGVCN